MSQIDNTILLLCLSNGFLLLLLVMARYKQQREIKNILREFYEIKQDFNALCIGTGGIGDHLNRVDRQMKRLYERQDQNDSRDPLHRIYDKAIKQVQRGSGIDEIMAVCGLARAEVELLMMLHRKKQTTNLSSLHSAA